MRVLKQKKQKSKDEAFMKEALIIFPNQLFKKNPGLKKGRTIFLIEEPKYFTAFKFHKKKLVLLRASMKYYYDFLESKGYTVIYVDYNKKIDLKKYNCFMLDPVDHELEQKYKAEIIETPGFLNTKKEIASFFNNKRRYSMASFYIDQRKKQNILVENGGPVGGKWSFDKENRLKIPKGMKIPSIPTIGINNYVNEAKVYVETYFSNNYGDTDNFIYPTTYKEAEKWLDYFLLHKLENFGSYEDAIQEKEAFLFHSVLSPLMNIGLLTPKKVIEKTVDYAKKKKIPLNSLEGFIRQIIGWREFVRAIYLLEGSKEKKMNFWHHKRKLSKAFYLAQTGIAPVDDVIKRVITYGYCHHIERLMVLGNFMLLTKTDPNWVYKWFMELFIDAYEWVMIPNVYGMSQYADGGMITTKPYISSSNYIRKMSNFRAGDWCKIWDGLYWNFIYTHKKFFKKLPRMAIMVFLLKKMDQKRLKFHLSTAKKYLLSNNMR